MSSESRSDTEYSDDQESLDKATSALGGNETALKQLTEEHLGTRDLDEADRRTRVLWEWRDE